MPFFASLGLYYTSHCVKFGIVIWHCPSSINPPCRANDGSVAAFQALVWLITASLYHISPLPPPKARQYLSPHTRNWSTGTFQRKWRGMLMVQVNLSKRRRYIIAYFSNMTTLSLNTAWSWPGPRRGYYRSRILTDSHCLAPGLNHHGMPRQSSTVRPTYMYLFRAEGSYLHTQKCSRYISTTTPAMLINGCTPD